ncbi:AAA family ATPase [Rhodococcus qingshengii]|uniref:AAA family ATPase n=1 Tax=Rhodococcus qingshengii TaxID=334542 RepID=UPI001C8B7ED6|nr:AAA family ATPase [Rhodococcus qingshengii]MBX9150033.1 hypothetical protein [Rhodococcus qingshengii]
MTTIKTRKPTGAVPWPLILVEGGEKTGKSWALAEFTASDKVGQAYWLDLGEGAADEYAAIEGADYLVLEHDGTWRDIHGQIAAVRQEAQRAHDAGEKPVVLLIDSMTAEWDMLKDWVGGRARQSKYAVKQLKEDPDAEIKPAMNLWNDANDRHGRLMHLLMTFPGIVVVTARGKMVAALDNNGRPIPNEKEYKVEGHKTLAFDVSAWVRLSRDEAPKIVGIRSVNHGLRPGVDKPKPAPQFTLEWLVFDALKCDPKTAKVRELQALDSTPDAAPEQPAQQSRSAADRFGAQQSQDAQVTAEELVAKARAAESIKALGELWGQVKFLPEPERESVYSLIRELKADMTALAAASEAS